MKQRIVFLAGFELLAGLFSAWLYRAGQAAVAVRPELAHVGYMDAVLAGHAGNWLWYHYPAPMLAVTLATAGIGGWFVLNELEGRPR